MNEGLFMKFILQFLVAIFGKERALFVFDHYRAHLTPPVIQTCRDNNVIPSLIPAGTTPMTQPLDTAINKPFKGLVKEFTEELSERKECLEGENAGKGSVGQHRVVTTEVVGRAWEEWHLSNSRRKIVIQSCRDTGISLPVDGSCDRKLKIKVFTPEELIIGDWAQSEEEMGHATTEVENTEHPLAEDPLAESRLQDE